jgi:hypothetical protein
MGWTVEQTIDFYKGYADQYDNDLQYEVFTYKL